MSAHRFRELDGLRGLAAVAVVISHLAGGYDSRYPGESVTPFNGGWGAFGVQLFFLISGYVILMTASRATRPSDFVISRASRLYPVYWMAVTWSIILSLLFNIPATAMSWADRLANYTMVQRWLFVPNVDEVYWTLAIEMQFYVLILLLLALTRCKLTGQVVRLTTLAWLTLSMVVVGVAGSHTRGLDPQLVATPYKLLLNLTLAEWAPLFSAGMFAYLSRTGDRRYRGLALACAIVAVAFGWALHSWRYALADLVVVTIFLVVVARPATPILLNRPAQWYGRISYSLYITHALTSIVVMHALIPVIGRIGAMIVAFAVVSLVAAAFHTVGEVRGTAAAKALLVRLRARWDRRGVKIA
ncbi:MAG: acyltransferase family protein [Nostocoides sp.]